MQAFRHFTFLARLVLAWFVLSLGVAVASPLVKPKDMLLVCTGAGAMQVQAVPDDGAQSQPSPSTMDCPLCVPASAPHSPAPVVLASPVPLAYASTGIPSAHIAARTAAPLPPRGPPDHS